MQKNDGSYTFLLAHKSESKIYIKRIAISKSYLHFSSVGLFLLLGITTLGFGLSGIFRDAVLAEPNSKISSPSLPASGRLKQSETIGYAHPPASADVAVNSGGPGDGTAVDGENSELDEQLRVVRLQADPLYLPIIWAHLGKINNEFGFRPNPFGGRTYEFHAGMDIDGERGDLVVAPANGTVIAAGYQGGYGNMVEIDHGNGLTTRYGHLSKIEIADGDAVTRGQLIAHIGSTGRSTGPHLHYELRLNDRSINPRHFLPQEPMDLSKIVKR